ncbi:snapalysin family zinc-dependent metalloprotease [Streptomyces sp. NPDC057638]|uniref:snapalysin family zinc-dependent metalloprotease n=1 Tax=Streptomyces sp. NPDC057638 TaxID=3346190 RepID=UPI0036B33567
MSSGTHRRALTAALIGTVLAVVAPATAVAAPAPDAAVAPTVRTLTYDATLSAEFRSAVDQGAAVWNQSVVNVQLRPVTPGQRADIRVIADNGWPRAIPTSLGKGTWYMGRQAVTQGYNTIRISSHEFGHLLGLPDRKPGPCSSLMSGSTGGVSCTNAYPNAGEKNEVEWYFRGLSRARGAVPAGVLIKD